MGLRSRRLLDRKTKNRKQDGILKISIEDFPQEIALYIFAKLPLLSLLEAKLVCNSWYYLATHPQLTSLHHLNDTNPNCLIIIPKTHDKNCPNYLHLIDNRYICDEQNNHRAVKRIKKHR